MKNDKTTRDWSYANGAPIALSSNRIPTTAKAPLPAPPKEQRRGAPPPELFVGLLNLGMTRALPSQAAHAPASARSTISTSVETLPFHSLRFTRTAACTEP